MLLLCTLLLLQYNRSWYRRFESGVIAPHAFQLLHAPYILIIKKQVEQSRSFFEYNIYIVLQGIKQSKKGVMKISTNYGNNSIFRKKTLRRTRNWNCSYINLALI